MITIDHCLLGQVRIIKQHTTAGAYGSISLDPNYNSPLDFDGDEDVDGSDLAEFAAGFV